MSVTNGTCLEIVTIACSLRCGATETRRLERSASPCSQDAPAIRLDPRAVPPARERSRSPLRTTSRAPGASVVGLFDEQAHRALRGTTTAALRRTPFGQIGTSTLLIRGAA